MPIYTISLTNKVTLADQTVLFQFEKPTNFQFIPGQYGGFTLISPKETDDKGINRRFSFASAPHDATLDIVTRIQTSAYKRSLNQLAIGEAIKLVGPSGQFILTDDKPPRPLTLLAGGVGIAPFMSMIRHQLTHYPNAIITLLYGNQSLQTAAFMLELTNLAKRHPHFNVIHTLDTPHDGWEGETGYIHANMVKKHLREDLIDDSLFYVCGAPAMVNGVTTSLASLTIPKERFFIEDFPGY